MQVRAVVRVVRPLDRTNYSVQRAIPYSEWANKRGPFSNLVKIMGKKTKKTNLPVIRHVQGLK